MAKVVVVDDSPTAVSLLETVLRHMGHSPIPTTDSRKALDLVKANHPGLLITDIFMPVVDGYELVEQVRSDPAIAATPVILWTASYVASKVRPIARALGVDVVLTKPCEPRELMEAIDAALALGEVPPAKVELPESVRSQHLEEVAASLSEEITARTGQLKALEGQLQAAQEHNQLLFDNHPAPMFIFDLADSRLLEVNEAALWRYGYSRDEFLGLHANQVLSDDRVLPDGARGPIGRRGPFAQKTKDGTSFEIETTSYDLVYQGREARFVTAEDVTERLKLERLLQQSQRLESLGQLAGGVAHDFNNLLAVILNFNLFVKRQMLEASKEPGGERWQVVLKDVDKIDRAAQNATRLTRQLLTFARKDIVKAQSTDVNVVVSETEQLLRRTLGEHIDFKVSAGAGLWPAFVDPGQLSQVVTNLAVNARDAMPSGGTLIVDTENVEVDEAYAAGMPALKPGRYVQLRVTDTGTGMTADTLHHAFEPFFTTKAAGHGTGLGLSTVHGIVTKAGGHVQISSEPDFGTRVTLLLPATEAAAALEASSDAPVDSGRGVVLVVEDDGELREIVQRILSHHGHEVLVAAHGPEAIARADLYPGHIDLLLTDVVMPRMLGTELARHLVATRPGLRVLFMSGYAEPLLDPSRSLLAGVSLLDKPFTEPTLLAKVGEALRPAQAPVAAL
jgi:PAS domain S-box-containing protein